MEETPKKLKLNRDPDRQKRIKAAVDAMHEKYGELFERPEMDDNHPPHIPGRNADDIAEREAILDELVADAQKNDMGY